MARALLTLIKVVQIAVSVVAAVGVLLLAATLLPELFGWHSYAVTSGSMVPAIPVGAAVVTRPLTPGDVHQGDVITFSVAGAPGVLVTHRVIGVDQTAGTLRLRTKGDANSSEDPVSPDLRQPLARVVYWVPLAGYLMDLGELPVVRALVVVCGLLLIWTTGWGKREAPAAGPSPIAGPTHHQPRTGT